mgnify:CR=1 FL=1
MGRGRLVREMGRNPARKFPSLTKGEYQPLKRVGTLYV